LAKDSDNLAGSFETENTGGLLSGFLAEEEEFDRGALWRLGSWGVGAVGAVIIAVMANQSQLSWRRDQIAAADLVRQAQQIQAVAKESQNQARQLASAIDTLNSDRDRLYSRVTTLEQGLDSVTGAIARQTTPAAAPPPAQAAPAEAPAAPSAAPAPAVGPVATTQPVSPAPDKPAAADKPVSAEKPSAPEKPVAAERPPAAEKPVVADKPPALEKLPVVASSEPNPPSAPPANQNTAKPASATPASPLVASRSMMAPPDPAAGTLIEPPSKPASTVTASPIPEVTPAPTSEAEAEDTSAPKAAVHKTQFGVDVGSANSVAGLRALWRGLLKSRSNASLFTLQPIIVIKEGANGFGMQLRLVAGPLNDAGAAAKICAVLTENQRPCETAIYDGQRLSLKTDDPQPAAGKPTQRRRSTAKRAAAPAPVAVEEPKKPEPTTISSLFGRKSNQ
jgi:hypothetical protein